MSTFKTRALLAEDETDAREILGFYLNTIFDDVVVAKDGKEGLDIYKEQKGNFDLVLTDIKMPHMDGIAMLEAIYAINKQQKFIIVSAYKDEEKLLRSIELKVLGYFIKPLNVDNVMKMLTKAKEEVLKEKQHSKDGIQINDEFYFDMERSLLFKNETRITLSTKETLLLTALVKEKSKIVSIDSLKEAVWDDTKVLDATFRTVMKRLKDKLGEDDFIKSQKGLGYIIE